MQERFTSGKPRPFRCVFAKANKRTGIAGEIIELEAATCEWIDFQNRIVRLQTSRQEHPIPVHFDLILTFQNQDIA